MNYLKYKIVLIIVFVLYISQSIAQVSDLKFLKNWELKGYALDADKKGDTYSAIIYIEEYVKRKP